MKKYVHIFIIVIFILLYVITSVISTIHSIDFFALSNSRDMSIFLAIAFEIGAAASLASIITYSKMNRTLVWSLFIILTLFQVMNNVYYTYVNIKDYIKWIELFGLHEMSQIEQVRIISFVSGGILPLIALGFIKALIDYLRPSDEITNINDNNIDNVIEKNQDNKIETTQIKKDKQKPTVSETDKFIEEIESIYNNDSTKTKEDDIEKKLASIRTGGI